MTEHSLQEFHKDMSSWSECNRKIVFVDLNCVANGMQFFLTLFFRKSASARFRIPLNTVINLNLTHIQWMMMVGW